MILNIACPVSHKKTGRTVRLIAWWNRDRLILKDMDAPGFSGLHFFPSEKAIGGESNTCPIVDLIQPLQNGMGWEVEGETSEGKKFKLTLEQDVVEQHIAYESDPPYAPWVPV